MEIQTMINPTSPPNHYKWQILECDPVFALIIAATILGSVALMFFCEPILLPIYLYITLPTVGIILLGVTIHDAVNNFFRN